MKLVPVRDFPWSGDYSTMHSLTCVNHPTARYLTKNPFARNIHLIKRPEGDIPRTPDTGECLCPFGDLAVIVPDSVSVPSGGDAALPAMTSGGMSAEQASDALRDALREL